MVFERESLLSLFSLFEKQYISHCVLLIGWPANRQMERLGDEWIDRQKMWKNTNEFLEMSDK